MKHWLDKRWQAAIAQRFPAKESGQLGQRQLFVLPSKTGMLWLLLALVVWLTGINYENALVLMMAYLLAAIWLSAMWLAYRNLLGIHYRVQTLRHGVAHEQAEVVIEFASQRRHYDLAVRCHSGSWRYTDVSPEHVGVVRVLVDLPHRGVFTMPPVRIETRQPFDLAVVWSRLVLSHKLYAYPVPTGAKAIDEQGEASQEAPSHIAKHGEVDHLALWQPGESTQHMRWHHLLLTGEARVLGFSRPVQDSYQHLDLAHYQHLGLEAALSAMAAQANQLFAQGLAYRVTLGTTTIALGEGPNHWQATMEALAKYGH